MFVHLFSIGTLKEMLASPRTTPIARRLDKCLMDRYLWVRGILAIRRHYHRGKILPLSGYSMRQLAHYDMSEDMVQDNILRMIQIGEEAQYYRKYVVD
jgi:hypothetical protein